MSSTGWITRGVGSGREMVTVEWIFGELGVCACLVYCSLLQIPFMLFFLFFYFLQCDGFASDTSFLSTRVSILEYTHVSPWLL